VRLDMRPVLPALAPSESLSQERLQPEPILCTHLLVPALLECLVPGHRHLIVRKCLTQIYFFYPSRRRHTRSKRDWSSDVCSSDLGYTGEDGFELYAPNIGATRLWETLVNSGADYGLVPCGLAARDSLRLEAGMPLYGNELDLNTTPYDAGLGRMIGFKKKETFFAREDLAELGETEPLSVLMGLTSEGRSAARS